VPGRLEVVAAGVPVAVAVEVTKKVRS